MSNDIIGFYEIEIVRRGIVRIVSENVTCNNDNYSPRGSVVIIYKPI